MANVSGPSQLTFQTNALLSSICARKSRSVLKNADIAGKDSQLMQLWKPSNADTEAIWLYLISQPPF